MSATDTVPDRAPRLGPLRSSTDGRLIEREVPKWNPFRSCWLAWQATGFTDTGLALPLCTLFGLFHGVVVSLMLVIVVAEHHPLERFREAGFRVGLTHVAAHVVYGLVIGLAVSSCDLRL